VSTPGVLPVTCALIGGTTSWNAYLFAPRRRGVHEVNFENVASSSCQHTGQGSSLASVVQLCARRARHHMTATKALAPPAARWGTPRILLLWPPASDI